MSMKQFSHNYSHFLLLLVLWSGTYLTSAQTIATNQSYSTTAPDHQARSLVHWLTELEAQYQVTFDYDADMLYGKKVEPVKVNQSERIEEVLQRVLPKLGLTFEKYRDNSFLIYPANDGRDAKLKSRPFSLQEAANHQVRTKVDQASRRTARYTRSAAPPIQSIQGQVTDLATDEGLPGVNVLARGTGVGTVTDIDGNYRIDVPDEADTLIFSSVGYETLEEVINGRSTINVSLSPDIQSLQEVVVVGYGEQERRDLVGAVSQVETKQIEELQVNSIEQALSGQVAGVQLRQNGAPGSGPEVLIRGIASTGANNAPLYVVDGVPLGNINSQRDNFILNAIDPNNIASISVLKDASSKAIYGSRAANGVVIIKTKQGKVGPPRITFSTSAGLQTIPEFEEPDVLNAEQLRQFRIQYFEDREAAVGLLGPREQAELDRLTALGNQGEGTDWFDEITRNAWLQEYNVNVNGGSEQARYNVSAGYLNQEGTLINTGFDRYNLNANVDIDVSDRIRFGFNLAPTRTIATGGRTDAGSDNFNIFSAVPLSFWTDPSAPVYEPDGSLNIVADGDITTSYNVSPVALLRNQVDERRTNQLLGSTYLELDIIEGLTARTFGSVNYIDRRNTGFTPSNFPGEGNITPNLEGTRQASANIEERSNFNLVWENSLTYNSVIANNHSIDALAMFVMENRRAENTTISAQNLVDESILIPSSENTDPANVNNFTGRGFTTENSLISLIGRVNYAYQDRYYLTGTIRRDGSSRFGSENRYGNFPSIAGAWRISNEPFFANVAGDGVLSELKIEAGYGISGSNANIDDFIAQGRIDDTNPDTPLPNYVIGGQLAAGSVVTELPNRQITWEEARELNLGLDVGLWTNKLVVSADYYDITTDGFLANLPLPSTSGFDNIITNLGSIRNRGVEVEITARDFLPGNITWEINANITRNRSEVLDLAAESGFIRPGAIARSFTETAIGQEVGLYYGLQTDGLFTAEEIGNPDVPQYGDAVEGSLKFVDGNEDGMLGDFEDAVVIGNPNPDFTYGMTHFLAYQQFDLRMVLVGAAGGQIFDGRNQYLGNQDGNFNVSVRQLDRWRPGDDPTEKVIPGTASDRSRQLFRLPNSLSLRDASYLWVRNITVGYNVSGEMVNNFFNNARIYFSVQNALLFTGYEDGNPEINRSGDTALVRNVNYGSYPVSRIFSLGLNVTF